MSCILFLDFDGVTHPDPCESRNFFSQLPLIEGVIRSHPGLSIVISSSWRFEHSLDELRGYFSADLRASIVGVNPVVTRTNDEGWIPRELLSHHREWECKKWLRQNGMEDIHWIAIDDVPQWFLPEGEHLLVTDSKTGIQPGQIAILEGMIGIS